MKAIKNAFLLLFLITIYLFTCNGSKTEVIDVFNERDLLLR